MKPNLLCLRQVKCEAITFIKRSHHLSLKWHWCDWCRFLTIPLQETQALQCNIIFFFWPLSVWRNKIFRGVPSSRDLETHSLSTIGVCHKCWRWPLSAEDQLLLCCPPSPLHYYPRSPHSSPVHRLPFHCVLASSLHVTGRLHSRPSIFFKW